MLVRLRRRLEGERRVIARTPEGSAPGSDCGAAIVRVKGARVGDLAIEQMSDMELVVNLKTARALGIRIPQSILVRADRVIE